MLRIIGFGAFMNVTWLCYVIFSVNMPTMLENIFSCRAVFGIRSSLTLGQVVKKNRQFSWLLLYDMCIFMLYNSPVISWVMLTDVKCKLLWSHIVLTF
jgi:hypothetical protein